VKGKLEMITAMLIFGSIGVFVRNIDLPSLEIAFLRATIGGLFLICTGFLIKHKISIKAIRGNALLLILSGIALGLNWVCLFQAYKYSTISLATISYYFAPVFIMMLSPTVLKERLTKRKIACIVIAMLGLLLILNMGDTSLNTSYNHVKGITYGLLGAALYAGVVLMNKFIKDLSGFDTSMIQLNISALVLLYEGLGDTIRVSLTGEPLDEVKVGFEILKSLNLRKGGINLISCPTCGRTQIDLINIAKEIEEKLANIKKPLKVAVMGCIVNGPGEAREADIGIAGGNKRVAIFKKGEIIKTVSEKDAVFELIGEIKEMLND
jgi:uncharacterized membrane protein